MMRNWIRLVEGLEGEKFTVYHGSPSTTPFHKFDPEHINSRTGKSYSAFFFSGSQRTAKTYMEIDEDLNPVIRAKYDELMGIYNRKINALMTELNVVLKQNGLPSIPEYNYQSSHKIYTMARNAEDPSVKTRLKEIYDEFRDIYGINRRAQELRDIESNLVTTYTGTLYRCEITLYRPKKIDLNGGSFQSDRWWNIFSTVTQTDADGVILYDCVDTGTDFGYPDTIYAVFVHDQIKIIDYTVIDN